MTSIRIFDEHEWWTKTGRLHEESEHDESGLFRGRGRGVSTTAIHVAALEPRPISSRPPMGPLEPLAHGRGAAPTTFHFAHTGVKLGEGFGARSGERAARFQLYIERQVATDELVAGGPAARAALMARRRGREGELVRDGQGELSLGSGILGKSPGERAVFWRQAAEVERRPGARVQARIIAELPHWLPPEAMRRIVASWGQETFGRHGLPWWAAVHEPDLAKGADPRNIHLHVVYSDRAATRAREGRWHFAPQKFREARGRRFNWGTEAPSVRLKRLTEMLASGTGRFGRPLTEKQRERARRQIAETKEVLAQATAARASGVRPGVGWIRALRTSFADAVNKELRRLANDDLLVERLYDPRSYRDAGIEKPPTVHLGPQRTFLERAGEPTIAGAVNRRSEHAWAQLCRVRHLCSALAELKQLIEDNVSAFDENGTTGVPQGERLNLDLAQAEAIELAQEIEQAIDQERRRIENISIDFPGHLRRTSSRCWPKARTAWARRQLKRIEAAEREGASLDGRGGSLKERANFLREIIAANGSDPLVLAQEALKRSAGDTSSTKRAGWRSTVRVLTASGDTVSVVIPAKRTVGKPPPGGWWIVDPHHGPAEKLPKLREALDRAAGLRLIMERSALIENCKKELVSFTSLREDTCRASAACFVAATRDKEQTENDLRPALSVEIHSGLTLERARQCVHDATSHLTEGCSQSETGAAVDKLGQLINSARPRSFAARSLERAKRMFLSAQPLEKQRRAHLANVVHLGKASNERAHEAIHALNALQAATSTRRWHEIVETTEKKLSAFESAILASEAARQEMRRRHLLDEVVAFVDARSHGELPLLRLMPPPPKAVGPDEYIREATRRMSATSQIRMDSPAPAPRQISTTAASIPTANPAHAPDRVTSTVSSARSSNVSPSRKATVQRAATPGRTRGVQDYSGGR